MQAHFGPTKNHRKYQSIESGSNGPSEAQRPTQTDLGQTIPRCSDKGRPRQAHQKRVGGGWRRWMAGRPHGRLTAQWAPPPQLSHMEASHWLPMSVLQGRAAARPWLPPINTREGVEIRTHTPQLTSLTTMHSCFVYRLSGV